jgi:hypothetical protein
MQCDIGATLPYPVFVNLWLNIEIQKQSIQSIIGATRTDPRSTVSGKLLPHKRFLHLYNRNTMNPKPKPPGHDRV